MIFSKLTDLIFPVRCPCCDKPADTTLPLCSSCKEKMLHPSEEKRRCEICSFSTRDCICKDRQYFDRLCIPLYYEDEAKKTLHRFKFRGRRDLAKQYARLLVQALDERKLTDSTDCITNVPMSRGDRFLRGYNQSQLIAEQISSLTGIPYEEFLYKKHKTKKQHSLGKEARSGNLLGAFDILPGRSGAPEGRTILVVDDILTTGSTLNEISKTLLIFGADRIFVCACAVTKNQKKH